jgi:hypothetical protein
VQRPAVGANFDEVDFYNKLVRQKFNELKGKAQSRRVRKRAARETVKKLTLELTYPPKHSTPQLTTQHHLAQVWLHPAADSLERPHLGGLWVFVTSKKKIVAQVLRHESCPDAVIELLAAVHDCRDRGDPVSFSSVWWRKPFVESRCVARR